MDIRKIIKEEIKKTMLNEGIGFIPVPKTFDHLKWKLTPNQKHYLQMMCEENIETISESEYKDASKFLGIPENSVRSIINTYKSDNPVLESNGGDSQAALNSRLTFGNKAANAFDIGIENNATTKPFKSSTQINNNPPTMSKMDMENKFNADLKNRTWYREGEGKEHPSKQREKFFEGLNKSLMMYLYCESNPKDINLRHDNKIELEFEPVLDEGKFNQLDGGSNFENEKYKLIKNLINEFNNKFNCSYVICDHIKSGGKIKVFIEHNVTKQIDMSRDSVDMMKEFLLTKVITGHKIEQGNAHIASLMGLDAGDTTWLYGPIGQAPQSGILTRNR